MTKDSQGGAATEKLGFKNCDQITASPNELSARAIMKALVKTETLYHLTNSSLQAALDQSIGLETIKCKVDYPENHTSYKENV